MQVQEYQQRLRQQIDRAPMAPLQILVVISCFVMNMIDGMDVLVMSFVAPGLAGEWGLSGKQVGWIFSTGLLGMMIGCLFIAPRADRVGRRPMLLLSLVLITSGMAGAALVDGFTGLIAARVVTGLGIGTILPVLAAIAAEFSNERRRNFCVGVVQAGWPIGAILTGVFCAWAIPALGWRSVFCSVAAVSALMLPLVWWGMPESLDFLSGRQPAGAATRIDQLLRRMHKQPPGALPPASGTSTSPSLLGSLLVPELRASTLCLWLGVFFGFITLYTLISWVPSFARSAGMPIALAIYAGTVLNLGAFAGSASIGALSVWMPLRKLITLFMFAAVAVMQVYGKAALPTPLLFLAIFLIGLLVQGGFNGYYPAAARIYPAQLRATGIGFAMGAGRTGAILGPLAAGYLTDAGVTMSTMFIVFSVPLAISGIAAFIIPSANLRR